MALNKLTKLGLGLAITGGIVNNALYNVDGGHRAVLFDRFRGVLPEVSGEGTHFLIPLVQRPIIFDIRSKPRNIPVITGSKDLQNVNITLRILFRPKASEGIPPNMAPNTVPISAILTVRPCSSTLKFQTCSMACSAPEITAVSKPNRKPPRATVTDQKMILALFIACIVKIKRNRISSSI